MAVVGVRRHRHLLLAFPFEAGQKLRVFHQIDVEVDAAGDHGQHVAQIRRDLHPGRPAERRGGV